MQLQQETWASCCSVRSGKVINLEVPGFGRAKGHSLLLRPRLQLREFRPRDHACTLSSCRGGLPSGPGERCRHSAVRTGRLLSRGPCTPASHCTAVGGESQTRPRRTVWNFRNPPKESKFSPMFAPMFARLSCRKTTQGHAGLLCRACSSQLRILTLRSLKKLFDCLAGLALQAAAYITNSLRTLACTSEARQKCNACMHCKSCHSFSRGMTPWKKVQIGGVGNC